MADAKAAKKPVVKPKPKVPTWVPPAETAIHGGKTGALDKLLECFEVCRDANTGGYGGWVCKAVKGWLDPKVQGKTTIANPITSCSPFTATVVGMMFDPSGDTSKDVFEPTYDKGNTALPMSFYMLHQGDNTMGESSNCGSIVKYGLAYDIDPKDMRRGDLLGWDWYFGIKKNGGHAGYCWDVHTNAAGEVDAYLFVSSNGQHNVGGPGVTVGSFNGYSYWLTQAKDGTYSRVAKKPKLFPNDANYDEDYIQYGHWVVLPGNSSIDTTTFRGPGPNDAMLRYPDTYLGINEGSVRCARFYGFTPPTRKQTSKKDYAAKFELAKSLAFETQPESYANGTSTRPKKEDKKKPHFEKAPATVVPKTTPRPPASTAPAGGTGGTSSAAAASPPATAGGSASAAGGKSSAPATGAAAAPAAPTKITQSADTSSQQQDDLPLLLKKLLGAKKIDVDPGDPAKPDHDKIKSAVTDFQTKYKLKKVDGIPGNETRPAVRKAVADLGKPPPPSGPTAPQITHAYFVPNRVLPGAAVTLIVEGKNLDTMEQFHVTLTNTASKAVDNEVSLTMPLQTYNNVGFQVFQLPGNFPAGATVFAELDSAGGADAHGKTQAPLNVGLPAPPPPSQPGKFTAIAPNTENEDVRLLQFLLNDWQKPLKDTKKVKVSAVLDADTIKLMKRFQKDNKLPDSDTATEDLWKALVAKSTDMALLGKIHPWELPIWPKRRFHASYSYKEGDLWTRTIPETSYETIDGLSGKKGTPIIYLSKLSVDNDGTTKSTDPTQLPATPLKWDDGTVDVPNKNPKKPPTKRRKFKYLNSNLFPYLAIGGAHDHDFKLRYGDVGLVIHGGKVAYGLYGDSAGGYVDGDETDDDRAKQRDSARFRCHRSGEASVMVHTDLGLSENDDVNMHSEFIWIVFPGTSFADGYNSVPSDFDLANIKKRGEALFKLIGGNP